MGRGAKSDGIRCFDVEIHNEFMSCRVFWAKIISSERENLLTQNTKHTFYELEYALEGRIGMTVGEESRHIVFDESDFIIIPPNTYHQIVDSDTVGARFIMAFTFTSLGASMSRVEEEMCSLLIHRETGKMRRMISLIIEAEQSDSVISCRRTNILIEALLLEIMDTIIPPQMHESENIHVKNTSTVKTTDRIKEYVHSAGGIGISVKGLSERFNVSPRHLARLFRSESGESPKEYINREKLARVEALVSTTPLSLSEISELCGFSDEYAMNKFFKRYTLMNLSDFRAIAQKQP